MEQIEGQEHPNRTLAKKEIDLVWSGLKLDEDGLNLRLNN